MLSDDEDESATLAEPLTLAGAKQLAQVSGVNAPPTPPTAHSTHSPNPNAHHCIAPPVLSPHGLRHHMATPPLHLPPHLPSPSFHHHVSSPLLSPPLLPPATSHHHLNLHHQLWNGDVVSDDMDVEDEVENLPSTVDIQAIRDSPSPEPLHTSMPSTICLNWDLATARAADETLESEDESDSQSSGSDSESSRSFSSTCVRSPLGAGSGSQDSESDSSAGSVSGDSSSVDSDDNSKQLSKPLPRPKPQLTAPTFVAKIDPNDRSVSVTQPCDMHFQHCKPVEFKMPSAVVADVSATKVYVSMNCAKSSLSPNAVSVKLNSQTNINKVNAAINSPSKMNVPLNEKANSSNVTCNLKTCAKVSAKKSVFSDDEDEVPTKLNYTVNCQKQLDGIARSVNNRYPPSVVNLPSSYSEWKKPLDVRLQGASVLLRQSEGRTVGVVKKGEISVSDFNQMGKESEGKILSLLECSEMADGKRKSVSEFRPPLELPLPLSVAKMTEAFEAITANHLEERRKEKEKELSREFDRLLFTASRNYVDIQGDIDKNGGSERIAKLNMRTDKVNKKPVLQAKADIFRQDGNAYKVVKEPCITEHEVLRNKFINANSFTEKPISRAYNNKIELKMPGKIGSNEVSMKPDNVAKFHSNKPSDNCINRSGNIDVDVPRVSKTVSSAISIEKSKSICVKSPSGHFGDEKHVELGKPTSVNKSSERVVNGEVKTSLFGKPTHDEKSPSKCAVVVHPTIADVVKGRERKRSVDTDRTSGSDRTTRGSGTCDDTSSSSSSEDDSDSCPDSDQQVDLDSEQTQTFSVTGNNVRQDLRMKSAAMKMAKFGSKALQAVTKGVMPSRHEASDGTGTFKRPQSVAGRVGTAVSPRERRKVKTAAERKTYTDAMLQPPGSSGVSRSPKGKMGISGTARTRVDANGSAGRPVSHEDEENISRLAQHLSQISSDHLNDGLQVLDQEDLAAFLPEAISASERDHDGSLDDFEGSSQDVTSSDSESEDDVISRGGQSGGGDSPYQREQSGTKRNKGSLETPVRQSYRDFRRYEDGEEDGSAMPELESYIPLDCNESNVSPDSGIQSVNGSPLHHIGSPLQLHSSPLYTNHNRSSDNLLPGVVPRSCSPFVDEDCPPPPTLVPAITPPKGVKEGHSNFDGVHFPPMPDLPCQVDASGRALKEVKKNLLNKQCSLKRGPGRPKKINEHSEGKRKRGRPKGSKNKMRDCVNLIHTPDQEVVVINTDAIEPEGNMTEVQKPSKEIETSITTDLVVSPKRGPGRPKKATECPDQGSIHSEVNLVKTTMCHKGQNPCAFEPSCTLVPKDSSTTRRINGALTKRCVGRPKKRVTLPLGLVSEKVATIDNSASVSEAATLIENLPGTTRPQSRSSRLSDSALSEGKVSSDGKKRRGRRKVLPAIFQKVYSVQDEKGKVKEMNEKSQLDCSMLKKKKKSRSFRSKHKNVIDPVFLADLENLSEAVQRCRIALEELPPVQFEVRPVDVPMPSVFQLKKLIPVGVTKKRRGSEKLRGSDRESGTEGESGKEKGNGGKRKKKTTETPKLGRERSESNDQRLPLKKRHRHISTAVVAAPEEETDGSKETPVAIEVASTSGDIKLRESSCDVECALYAGFTGKEVASEVDVKIDACGVDPIGEQSSVALMKVTAEDTVMVKDSIGSTLEFKDSVRNTVIAKSKDFKCVGTKSIAIPMPTSQVSEPHLLESERALETPKSVMSNVTATPKKRHRLDTDGSKVNNSSTAKSKGEREGHKSKGKEVPITAGKNSSFKDDISLFQKSVSQIEMKPIVNLVKLDATDKHLRPGYQKPIKNVANITNLHPQTMGNTDYDVNNAIDAKNKEEVVKNKNQLQDSVVLPFIGHSFSSLEVKNEVIFSDSKEISLETAKIDVQDQVVSICVSVIRRCDSPLKLTRMAGEGKAKQKLDPLAKDVKDSFQKNHIQTSDQGTHSDSDIPSEHEPLCESDQSGFMSDREGTEEASPARTARKKRKKKKRELRSPTSAVFLSPKVVGKPEEVTEDTEEELPPPKKRIKRRKVNRTGFPSIKKKKKKTSVSPIGEDDIGQNSEEGNGEELKSTARQIENSVGKTIMLNYSAIEKAKHVPRKDLVSEPVAVQNVNSRCRMHPKKIEEVKPVVSPPVEILKNSTRLPNRKKSVPEKRVLVQVKEKVEPKSLDTQLQKILEKVATGIKGRTRRKRDASKDSICTDISDSKRPKKAREDENEDMDAVILSSESVQSSEPPSGDEGTKLLAGKRKMPRWRKKYLVAGLFSDYYKEEETRKKVSDPFSPRVKFLYDPEEHVHGLLPPPCYCRKWLRERQVDFTLPHDLWWLHTHNMLPGRDIVPSWNYRRIKANIYYDVKPNHDIEVQVCNCKRPIKPTDKGCGDECINRMMYIECSPQLCPVSEVCSNQPIQRHESVSSIARFMTRDKGWGVKVTQDVAAGAFLLEYVGEVVTEREFVERMHTRYVHDTHHYCLNLDRGLYIDGHRMGGDCRFVNHSCLPNCEMQKWYVNGHYRMGLFALDDIPSGTELAYDYNFTLFNPNEGQECKCGADNCRGVIGVRSQRTNGSVGGEGKKGGGRGKKEAAKKRRRTSSIDAETGVAGDGSLSRPQATSVKPLTLKESLYVRLHRCFLLRNFEKVRLLRERISHLQCGGEKKSPEEPSLLPDPQEDPLSRVERFLTHFTALNTARSVKTRRLTQAEDDPEMTRLAKLAQIFKDIFDKLVASKDSGGQKSLAHPFLALPSRKKQPQYYARIGEPIDLSQIEKNILSGTYLSADAFDRDVMRLFANNLRFYGRNSNTGQSAVALRRVYSECRLQFKPLLEEVLGDEALPAAFASNAVVEEFEDEEVIRCICNLHRDEGVMIQCEKCLVWQHCDCMDVADSPEHYLCEECHPRPVSLEVPMTPQPPDAQQGHKYYVTLLRDALQVKQGDSVYILRDKPNQKSIDRRQPAYKLVKDVRWQDLLIFKVENLWIDENGDKFAFGHHYLRPHETFHEPWRKFFTNEVIRSPLYEILPLDMIVAHCWVLDLATYCRGRPIGAQEEHVYVCEFRVDKAARMFSKISRPKYPVCTKDFAFVTFSEKLRPLRTYTPHELTTVNRLKGTSTPEVPSRSGSRERLTPAAVPEDVRSVTGASVLRKVRRFVPEDCASMTGSADDAEDLAPLSALRAKAKARKVASKRERVNNVTLKLLSALPTKGAVDLSFLLSGNNKRQRKKTAAYTS